MARRIVAEKNTTNYGDQIQSKKSVLCPAFPPLGKALLSQTTHSSAVPSARVDSLCSWESTRALGTSIAWTLAENKASQKQQQAAVAYKKLIVA